MLPTDKFCPKRECIIIFTLLLLSLPIFSAADNRGAVRLDKGDVIPVQLDDSLSSRTARRGETFQTTVLTDEGTGYDLPAGSKITGSVVSVRRQYQNNPGELDLKFWRISLPDGRSYMIDGALIGLDNKSVIRTEDGRLIATPGQENTQMKYLGYGAGAGLLVGIITKHTFEDTLLGAGLGYLFGSAHQPATMRDVTLHSGTRIGVRIDRSLVLDVRNSNMSGSQNSQDGGYHIGESGYNPNDSSSSRSRPVVNNQNEYADNRIRVTADGRDVSFKDGEEPINQNNVIMLPLQPISQALRLSVRNSDSSSRARVRGEDGSWWTIRVGSNQAIDDNGDQRTLDSRVENIDGCIYAPLDLFTVVTNREVTFDSSSDSVIIRRGRNENGSGAYYLDNASDGENEH